MRASQRFTNEEQNLADIARKAAMNRNVLYHGTRYGRSILRAGVLFTPFPGEPKISFTRSPEIAAYFALLERFNDEGCGTILVFDRDSLHSRHKIKLVRCDTGWGHEAEEEIWDEIPDVAKHLVGFISGTKTSWSTRHRLRGRFFSMQTDTRLKELRLPVPAWCRQSAELEENLKRQLLACNALNSPMDIAAVAERVGLRIDTVRRLAASLQQPERDWNLAAILLSWGLIDRNKLRYRTRPKLVPVKIKCGKGISVIPVDADRIEALVYYSGKSRSNVLKELHRELPCLINELMRNEA